MFAFALALAFVGVVVAQSSLQPLCPPPPYDDDVHINCSVEQGFFAPSVVDAKKCYNIVEYNIDRNAYGGDGSNENGLQPIIDLLLNSSLVPTPDILILSEVARGCVNSGGINISGAEEIAKQLRMNFVYAVEYVDIDQSNPSLGVECTNGNAILSSFPISNIKQLRFSSQCCRYGGRYGGRIDVMGDVSLPSSSGASLLHVHSTHLESGQSNVEMVLQSLVVRAQQAKECGEVRWRDGRPVVLGGDLNSPLPKIDPTIRELEREGLVNAHADAPVEKIQLDYLFSRPASLSAAGYCADPDCAGLSDHVPYWATYCVE